MNEYDEDFLRLVDNLRSSLNATELTLSKFNQYVRSRLLKTNGKPSEEKAKGIIQIHEMLGKIQLDFNNFKGNMDLLLGMFTK
jgi:hypothetical protein